MLYLNDLHIKNFKNIENLHLKFSKINLISGEAGNGKSAIQQVLTLLLCNYIEGRLEDYVNWNNDSDEYNLLLNFKFLNNKYEYIINCGKKAIRFPLAGKC